MYPPAHLAPGASFLRVANPTLDTNARVVEPSQSHSGCDATARSNTFNAPRRATIRRRGKLLYMERLLATALRIAEFSQTTNPRSAPPPSKPALATALMNALQSLLPISAVGDGTFQARQHLQANY